MTDPVDLANLREMTDGDVEMEQMLFEEFYSSSDKMLATLGANICDGESEEWRSSAHALKGTSLNMGADKLGELCKHAQEAHGAPMVEKQRLFSEIKEE